MTHFVPLITGIDAYEVLDSRGKPTVEVEIDLGGGTIARATAPSGASTGSHEALEKRDGGNSNNFNNLRVTKVVSKANAKLRSLAGQCFNSQEEFDNALIKLDGTPNKSSLGANVTTAASMAFLHAIAALNGEQAYEYLGGNLLPVPFFNVINGGKHAPSGPSIQEFMIAPAGFDTFAEALMAGAKVYHGLRQLVAERFGSAYLNNGDEGGFAPPFKNTEDTLGSIQGIIDKAGYSGKIMLSLDVAASDGSFYLKPEQSVLPWNCISFPDTPFYYEPKGEYKVDGILMGPDELRAFYVDLAKKYQIVSIEDPFHEEAFSDFAALLSDLKGRAQIVGDDISVTNSKRVKQGIELNAFDTLLYKVNQTGTVSEADGAASLCTQTNRGVMVSHRSGETGDVTIVHIAVGKNYGQIKSGAPARERNDKYNELVRIERRLGDKAVYAGTKWVAKNGLLLPPHVAMHSTARKH